jgi:hypothetical protein
MMGLIVQELIRGLDFYGRRRRLEVLARMPRANQRMVFLRHRSFS